MSESNDAAAPAEPAAAEEQPQGGTVTPIRPEVARSSSLEIIAGQKWWTAPQLAALASIGLEDCPDADRMAFLHLCQSTGLDPFRREIYLLGRKVKNGNAWGVRWTPQTGIDGFRHLAEESGVYGGRVGPQWADSSGHWLDVWLDKEPPRAARTGVIRTDRPAQCRICGSDSSSTSHGVHDDQHAFEDERITWAIALYDEYVPMEKQYEGSGDNRRVTGEQPTSMWRKMPAAQLAKCSEAAAIRAAFPRRAAGLYEHAEMDAANQAAREVEEHERDKQRRELADRPWASTPSGAKGVVLDGSAAPAQPAQPTYDRTVLLAELEEQARGAKKSVTQYTTRWAAANKKNIDQATDAELEAFLASRRDTSAPPPADPVQTPAEEPAEAPATATAPAEPDHGLSVESVRRPEDVANEDAEASREPGEGQTALLGDDDVDAEQPPLHDFEALPTDPKQCAWCDAAADDPTAHLG